MKDISLAIIGAGNMGSAIVHGMLDHAILPADRIILTDPHVTALNQWKEKGCRTNTDNAQAVQEAQVILLAVKPQIMHAVLTQVAPAISSQHLVISIAAGISIHTIATDIGDTIPLVRVMPNLCARVGDSMSAWVANPHVSPQQKQTVQKLLGAIGTEQEIQNESLMDAVTAVSGSGPAYFFILVQAMEEQAQAFGLDPQTARTLVLQTFVGAAHTLASSDMSAEDLASAVTSKGGTTEAALQHFSTHNLSTIIQEGMKAAHKRAQDLNA